jgi:hypothetical protein
VEAGLQSDEIARALSGMEEVSVLRVEGLRPGVFGGFGTDAENADFDAIFAKAVGKDAKWCCRFARASLARLSPTCSGGFMIHFGSDSCSCEDCIV